MPDLLTATRSSTLWRNILCLQCQQQCQKDFIWLHQSPHNELILTRYRLPSSFESVIHFIILDTSFVFCSETDPQIDSRIALFYVDNFNLYAFLFQLVNHFQCVECVSFFVGTTVKSTTFILFSLTISYLLLTFYIVSAIIGAINIL